MSEPPSLLLVHGAWHGAWAFDELVPHLTDVPVATVDLPGAGSTATLADDAAVVRQAVDDTGGPVVVLGHSYGGIVISEACAGAPGVVGLVYLCAFMLDVGQSLLEAIGGTPPDWAETGPGEGQTTVARPVDVFYADVDPALAEWAVARLRPQSLHAFTDPQTAAAWHDVPSTYVVCEQDAAIPAAAQEAMSVHAATVERLDASHSPFLSQPRETAALVRAAVERAPV